MVTTSVTMESAKTPNSAARIRLAPVMMRCRSWRSMKTPAGSDKTNHGSMAAKLTALIMRESFVRLSARSGAAAPTKPSPRLDVVDAANCRQNAEGSRVDVAGVSAGFITIILTSMVCRGPIVESIR